MRADHEPANDHSPSSVPPVFDNHHPLVPEPLGWQKNLPQAPDAGSEAQERVGKRGLAQRWRSDPIPKQPRDDRNDQ